MANERHERYIRYYTEGTAARQVEVQEPGRTGASPKHRKKPQKVLVFSVNPVAIGAVVLSIVMLVLMFDAAGDLRAERARQQEMVDYLYRLESENWAQEQRYNEALNLEEVAEQALVLGMIPVEEAKRVVVQVAPAQVETVEEPDLWERFWTYVEGLFA